MSSNVFANLQDCFHQLFARQVAAQPDHPAVICHEQQLTYAELNARANQLAHHLRARGAGPESLIPICVTRSAQMVIGILGILKAGAAYVPIDPEYPAERIDFMLRDTSAPLMVTQSMFAGRLAHNLAHNDTQLILLDTDQPLIAQRSRENPADEVTPDNAAYVIYTSGSTGQPKGTLLTQANLTHYVLALQDELQISPADRYLHLASIAFSSSRRHLMLPLAHGATVVLADEEQRLDPLALFRLIKQERVTIFDAVPSFQRHCTNTLRDLPAPQRVELLDNQLRLILSASEPLLSDVPRAWKHEFQHPAQHVHMFGQTETSGIVALHHITEEDCAQTRVVPVGCPLARTEIYLLDEQLRPVPDGEPGEIYVHSAGLGRGYLNRAELTAEKFIEWSVEKTTDYGLRTTNTKRVCRTGDFARRLPDGTLECLGRQDHQIKLRGFRIEPGEIEAVLLQHPAVRECVVVVRADVRGNQHLVAYFVTLEQTTITPELRQLTQHLPAYLRPAAFVQLMALPLTPNGKADRRALPEPDETAFESHQPFVAPHTETEKIVAAIWAEVLQLRQPGRHDHFFELGGHSLLAGQIISRLRMQFQIELPLRALFEAPTIAELAVRIEHELQAEAAPASAPLLPQTTRTESPLSFAQQRLWFLDKFEPGSATYNLRRVVRLTGRLEVTALHRALQLIVNRHDSLRTRFRETDGQAMQVIAPSLEIELPLEDLSASDDPARAAERLALEISSQPFDLSNDVLLRVSLLRLSETQHDLIVVFHHIISDGWSLGVFFQELSAIYQQLVTGRETSLPALPIQYADYAAWQRERLQGAARNELLSFWQQHLAGAPSLLELPTDRPRPAAQRYQGAQLSLRLSAALTDELRTLSQREGVTLFMTLLAAFQVLLARYSQQEQLVVGTPVAGRTHSETETLIGLFVNTLALRGDLSGNPTFRELLVRTRERALGAYAHQELPFEKLVEELQPERSLSYSPIFQVMFALQNVPQAETSCDDLQFQTIRYPSRTAKFDLSLDVYEDGNELETRLEYDTDLFEAATAERLLDHFQTLLQSAIRQPEERIATLPLLTANEEQQVLTDWNQRRTEVPARCLHQLIEAQAAAHPDAIAVAWNDQQITYSELNARANQLARFLQKNGVTPETIVGLCVERSLEMMVGVLGVLKAGAAYLPLDPNYPAERLSHMLSDANVSALLTQQRLASVLAECTADIRQRIDLEADWQQIAQESSLNPDCHVTPDNLAYVIFTSGSTGKSKGVMVTHGNVVNAFAAWEEAYQLSHLRAHLQMASFSFDVFTGDLTRALCSGAKLVLCPTEYLLEPEALLQLMQREGVDAAEFVPAVIRPLMESLEEGNQRLDFMRLLVVGSDVWQMEEYRRLRRLCGAQTRVISSYGVTEATIDSTFFESTEIISAHDGIVPIGRPFANTQMYLLDAHQQPVPVGVPGELYIGGAGVARGYLNRAELTAERFIERTHLDAATRRRGDTATEKQSATELFAEERGTSLTHSIAASLCHRVAASKLYRTGDVGRYRTDGTIELLGRADQQVKLRGYRIEPGEIEAALRQHPAVRDCAVIVREDEPGDQRLVAYLVATDDEIPKAELRQLVKEQLPEYMIPSAFVPMSSLPLTPNGKVDRRGLPAPDQTSRTPQAQYVAPRTPLEEKVAAVLASLLKLERVSVTDNFFDLGGHSLLVMQALSRIRSLFHLDMPLRVFFESPTVAGLAVWLGHAIRNGHSVSSVPLKSQPAHTFAPQSYAQQRLWFLDQFNPGSSVYHLPAVVRIKGALRVSALEQSLNELIRRHAVLRTFFSLHDGEPVQIVSPDCSLELRVTDLTSVTETERDAVVLRLAAEEAEPPFNLTQPPLLRARLLKLNDEEHALALIFHHIISDGWSLGIFFRELGELYHARLHNEAAALPELNIQYADYALWQQQQLSASRLTEQLAFWKGELAGAPSLLTLPTDRPRPAVQFNRGAQLQVPLSAELSHALRTLSQREGVTLFMTLLAAFQVLLARYSQQEQLVVGTPVAGRTSVETEALIGYFVNTLALRGDLSGNPTFQELLARTRERALGAYTHQELPFEKLVEELQPERSLSYSPIFQVMFALQNTPVADLRWNGLQLTPLKLPAQTSKFDLSLDVFEEAAGLHLWFEYDTDLFEAATIATMSETFCQLLDNLVRDPQQRLQELLPLSVTETINRNALPVASPVRSEKDTDFVAPRTATEEMIAEIFAGVLRKSQVSVKDDFFDLGGHSLLAAKVIFRLREVFGINLSLRSIFEHPTTARLAAVIDRTLAEKEDQEMNALLAELEELSEEEAEQLLLTTATETGFDLTGS